MHGSAPVCGAGIADRAAIHALLLDFLGYGAAASAVRRAAYATPHTGDTRRTAQAVRAQVEREAGRV